MERTKSLARVAAVSVALAAAVAAAPALSAELTRVDTSRTTVKRADADRALAAAIRRDLGLSAPQLAQYLAVERLARQQQGALRKAQGRNFGGSWIEKRDDGGYRLVVATTSPRPQKAPAGAEIRQVRHSAATLDAAKARLDDLVERGARLPKGVYGWRIDLPSNSVVVSVGKGGQQAGVDLVAASSADAETIRFETVAEQPSLRMDVLGGYGYLRNPGDGYLYACSVGFSIVQGGTPGYATAGHCGDPGETAYYEPSQWTLGERLGSFVASNFPAPGNAGNDYAWVRLDANHYPAPVVYGYGGGNVTVYGLDEAPVGGAICRSGRTTGWRCGTLQAKGVTVNYNTGETILNLTQTSACSEGGDSGGSFITSGGQAQGVLSGGSGSCSSGGTSFFQPLLPILQAYGLSLLVSG